MLGDLINLVFFSFGFSIEMTNNDIVEPTCRPSSLMFSTTTTTSSVTTASGLNTAPSDPVLKSPFDDPRIGWIHELTKDNLVGEMSRYGLDTTGNVATLRKRFAAFWKSPLGGVDLNASGQTAGARYRNEATTSENYRGALEHSFVPSGAPVMKSPATQPLLDEYSSVREMLGLSPNADSTTVKRTLAAMISVSRSQEVPETRESTRRPVTQVTYSDQWMGTAPLASASQTAYRPLMNSDTYRASLDMRGESIRRSERDFIHLFDIVRKWNLRFDGRKDAIAFLERLEELIDSYSLDRDQLIRAMPELLTGIALLWYRNCKDEWATYRDFRFQFVRQFFPRDYDENLDEEIRKRTQGENETFRDFVLAITTLIRRSNNFSAHRKLETIYSNMRPDYKLMVRRSDFNTLPELTLRAEEYEAFEKARRDFRPPPPPSHAMVQETAYFHRRRPERMCEGAVVDKAIKVNSCSAQKAQDPEPSSHTPSMAGPWRCDERQPSPVRRVVSFRNEHNARTATGGNSQLRSPSPGPRSSTASPSSMTCWNCDQTGHRFKDCPQPKILRCFNCKKVGVATTKCTCRSGNGQRGRR